MVAFGFRVYVEPTSITDEEIESLHSHGYRDREISDTVGIVAHNVITGAFNIVAGLKPRTRLRARLHTRWQDPSRCRRSVPRQSSPWSDRRGAPLADPSRNREDGMLEERRHARRSRQSVESRSASGRTGALVG